MVANRSRVHDEPVIYTQIEDLERVCGLEQDRIAQVKGLLAQALFWPSRMKILLVLWLRHVMNHAKYVRNKRRGELRCKDPMSYELVIASLY